MKKSILIRGFTGFVGKNLTTYLIENGFQNLSLLGRNTPINYSNINKIEEEIVIHLAGLAHDLDKKFIEKEFYEVNCLKTNQLIDLLLYGFGVFDYTVAELGVENGFQNIEIFDENKPYNLTLKNREIFYLGKYNPKIHPNVPLLITIVNNETKANITQEVQHQTISLIHNSVQISQNSKIENGCIIMQNFVIHANTIIKYHCIINSSSVIDYDCEADSFVHIKPLVYIGSKVSW